MTIRPIGLKAARAAHRFLWWVRQVTGDAAYENYLRCVRGDVVSGAYHERKLLSREEFYLDTVRRRYSTPSRCC
jgi:hypothetical protein